MGRRKDRYVPKSFESSINSKNDIFASIYLSMIKSDKWKNLSKNQQLLYVYCKFQYYGEKNCPKPMVKKLTEEEYALCFTMNKSKWCKAYNLYKEGNQAMFYKDMDALISNGFIELVECGKTSRTKNIYKFSNKWNKET